MHSEPQVYSPSPAGAKQELRIALMMNGGVSLAIWMGGVTLELDRVRRADGAYGELLALTETEARVDVIAGASAGGINGAVLALAIARGSTVESVRELWMQDGDIAALLRDPTRPDASSLLLGDEQLLVKLHDALTRIGEGGTCRIDESVPLHLSITGTIPKGKLTRYPDAFGAMIPDVTHRALFRFRRPARPTAAEEWPDDFAHEASSETADTTAARLALAARSSASFPAAFEPSFVPVGLASGPMHPDMEGIADFDEGQLVIDGGVLVNTPIEQVLDAIRALPADRPVRRVLGYVVPDPEAPSRLPERDPSPMDVVIDAISRLPRVQSVGRELAEIKQNNEDVRRRREARRRVLDELDGESVFAAAAPLLQAYLGTRREAAAEEVAQLIVKATGTRPVPDAAQLGRLRVVLGKLEAPPWLPAWRPPPENEPAKFAEVPVTPWAWGFAPLENAANLALQAIRVAAGEPDRREESASRAGAIAAGRRSLHRVLGELRRIEADHRVFWKEAALQLYGSSGAEGDPDAERIEAVAAGWTTFSSRLDLVAGELARLLSELLLALNRFEDARERFRGLAEPGQRALRMLDMIDPGSREGVLRPLLAVEVIQRSAGADLAGIEQAVELVLMSGTANAFGRERPAAGKLAGLQAGHFGAFYKASWRANDWMWGRLDGADRLVRALLDPARIMRRLNAVAGEDGAMTVEQALAQIRRIACREDGSEEADWLAAAWAREGDEQGIREALKGLQGGDGEPAETALEPAYAAIARRLQIEIVAKELPKVAGAVPLDRKAGADPDSFGGRWYRRYFQDRSLNLREIFVAFEACRIGAESLETEVDTRRFMKVSTKAVAVIGSLLAAALPRVKPLRLLKPPLAAIRWLLLIPYRIARALPPRDGG
jgi:patatin-related protein